MRRRGIELKPLQSPGASLLLRTSEARLLDEMRLRLPDGRVYGGAGAVMEIARQIWWAWPLWVLSRIPGAMFIMNAVYRWIADHRVCSSGTCDLERRIHVSDAVPLLVFPLIACVYANGIAPWTFMWALALALYAGCKWLSYRDAEMRGAAPSAREALGYLLAWPGMDARTFLDRGGRVAAPEKAEWMAAACKTAVGLFLLSIAARDVWPLSPLLRGWLGMLGAILALHFGAFALLSLAWRKAGVNAPPLMNRPLASRSLAELWGRRWNTGFHVLVERFVFRKTRSTLGTSGAVLLTFFVSGLIHDSVISVPARGGYGLPTAYFTLQDLAMLFERSSFGQRLGFGRGQRGRLFTFVISLAPVAVLFHPPFVHTIILPMLNAIGDLERNVMNSLMNLDLATMLRIAGILHLGLLVAGSLMPKVLGLRGHLAMLPPLVRQIFWVYYAFIALCLVSFCVITIVFADTLASGTTFARALCAFFALFWTLRLVAGTFVFDLRPYLSSSYRRAGLAAMNITFMYLPVVYAWAAAKPMWQ
jgi:alginate O-acetyltransferase complex protein AlgI